MSKREVLESPLAQGVNEQIAYTVTTTPWGTGTMSVVGSYLHDVTDPGSWLDVSSTKMSGSNSSTSTTFTSKKVIDLLPGRTYRLTWRFTIGSNTHEAYAIIKGES